MTTAQIPTLYEWVGGIERIKALFKAFYERVPTDPILAPVFAKMAPEHFETVARFVSEVLGGPRLYSGDGVGSPFCWPLPMSWAYPMIPSFGLPLSATWSGAHDWRSSIRQQLTIRSTGTHPCRSGAGAR